MSATPGGKQIAGTVWHLFDARNQVCSALFEIRAASFCGARPCSCCLEFLGSPAADARAAI
jgi:hypothetical protein